MRSCLSDRALTRVLAELGTPGEHAHLAVCAGCAERRRRLEGEITRIARVLTDTPEPRARARPVTGRWIGAAAALAVVVAGVWLSLAWFSPEIGDRVQAPAPVASDLQVAVALADVTSALFSVDGEPRGIALEPDAALEPGCDAAARIAGLYCIDGGVGLDEGTDALDLEITGLTAGSAAGHDDGA